MTPLLTAFEYFQDLRMILPILKGIRTTRGNLGDILFSSDSNQQRLLTIWLFSESQLIFKTWNMWKVGNCSHHTVGYIWNTSQRRAYMLQQKINEWDHLHYETWGMTNVLCLPSKSIEAGCGRLSVARPMKLTSLMYEIIRAKLQFIIDPGIH